MGDTSHGDLTGVSRGCSTGIDGAESGVPDLSRTIFFGRASRSHSG